MNYEHGRLPDELRRIRFIPHQIAAISVGTVNGIPPLDLRYEEDVAAKRDLR